MKEIGLFALMGFPVALVSSLIIPFVGWIVLTLWLVLMAVIAFLFAIELFFQLFPGSPQPPPVPKPSAQQEEDEEDAEGWRRRMLKDMKECEL